MAFKPSSLQRDYTIISEFDETLDLPVVPKLGAEATAEERAAADLVAADRALKLKTARAQSDWKGLIKLGASPTLFLCRQIPGTAIDWWHDQKVGEMERQTLLVRLAIKSIDNFPIKVKHTRVDGHLLLAEEVLDEIYAIETDDEPRLGRKIVAELAGIVMSRVFRGLDPLSDGG